MVTILAPETALRRGGSDTETHYSDAAADCDSILAVPAIARRRHSRGWKPLPGTCQPRCSPPSNAIIWPVIEGALKM